MFLGYNTNGLAHHELIDAIELVAEIGYRGVAITIDHHALSQRTGASEIKRVRDVLARLGLRSVIETGARYLLDPRHKHEPTLVSADPEGRKRRVEFYKHAIRCAAELSSDCVSIWSGVLREAISPLAALDRLAAGLAEVLDFSTRHGVTIAFEPEPGMLIDTAARLVDLFGRIDSPQLVPGPTNCCRSWDTAGPSLAVSRTTTTGKNLLERLLGVTLDVGHLCCSREPVEETIGRWGPRLKNVHIEDMRPGVHEHLMFGEGEVDFPGAIAALFRAGYSGGLYVELSRHSHLGPEAARRAYDFLTPLIERLKPSHG